MRATVSVTETYVNATPEAVFDVLADPCGYAHWVVGASRTRKFDRSWPRPGSKFHHTQGFFGIGLPDNTEVVCSNPPRQLVLEARIRPFAVNKVEMRLRPSGPGTQVTMIEYPVGGIAEKVDNPLMDKLLHLRNVESLRRLRRMAEDGRTRR
jgi:uncharacterized protein YndB with AHSA1/START domain